VASRQITVDAVLEALGRVNYPGYATDVVSLGIIETVEPLETAGGSLSSSSSPPAPRISPQCHGARNRKSGALTDLNLQSNDLNLILTTILT